MRKDLTEIAFVLDRSGSMSSISEAAVKGFNDFLGDQKKSETTEANFSLLLFDDKFDKVHSSVPISQVRELTAETFQPRGMTALLDAIGKTIDELGKKLAATPEADRPSQVIVAILTDGEENSSSDYSRKQVSDMITHQKDVYSWQFFFLAANQDAIATAANMGIDKKFASNFASDAQGFEGSTRAMSRKIRAIRASSLGAAISVQEQEDLAADLSDLQKQEDKRPAPPPRPPLSKSKQKKTPAFHHPNP